MTRPVGRHAFEGDDHDTAIGAWFFTQYWVIDPGANGVGMTFTRGIETVLGSR